MESIYLPLHCHHQNGFCFKMGSDESHFNVSLIVRDRVHKPQLLKRKERRSSTEPKSFRLPAYRLIARPNRLSSQNQADRSKFIPSETETEPTMFSPATFQCHPFSF